MAKQHEQNENDDNNPDDAMAATAIVASAIAPIASPAAKQQDNQDDENEKTHGSSVFGTSPRCRNAPVRRWFLFARGVNELWGDQRRWLECAKRDLSKSVSRRATAGKAMVSPSAGQESTAEVAMPSMPHARAAGNVAQGDAFFKSIVQPFPAQNKSLRRLRSKFTCDHRSIRVKPIHVRHLFVKNAGWTRREHIFGDYAASPPIQGEMPWQNQRNRPRCRYL
jgi:hypothetical protein